MSGQMTNDESKRMSKRKKRHLIPSLMLLCGFVSLLLISPAGATVVTVETKTVRSGDHFLVNITCVPSQPVKAWEFLVITTLPVLNISIGDFFQRYQVFSILSNPCYALTLGKGNMTSDPGVLLRLLLRADEPGVYQIGLNNAGVTDNLSYIPCTFLNGTIVVMGVTELRSQKTIKDGWNSFMPYTWATITSLRIAWRAVFGR